MPLDLRDELVRFGERVKAYAFWPKLVQATIGHLGIIKRPRYPIGSCNARIGDAIFESEGPAVAYAVVTATWSRHRCCMSAVRSNLLNGWQ